MSDRRAGPVPHPRDAPAADSDAELLRRHVDGDPHAFEALFRRHRDRLWGLALRTLGERELAADALQEAMVSAVRRAGSYRGDAAVTTWLHRIVVNACIDQVRRAKARAADPLTDDLDRVTALRSVEHEPDLADHIAERSSVQTALTSLPPEQRAALVLVDMEGYSVAEAARLLECAEGTVKSRCARGRARLAPLLRAVWNPEASETVSPRTSPEPLTGGEPV
jgi:RNA polymerase sigma-70 factor, ECF subfamily